MSTIGVCPKCGGEMIAGSKENLESNFGCTRPDPPPENPRKVKVQSYYCQDCGYMEFYRERRDA